MVCASCGSHDVSRASSVAETDEKTGTQKPATTSNAEAKSTSETLEDLYKKKFK